MALARSAGCAAKVGPADLSRVLRLTSLTSYAHPNLMIGLQTSDDAAVIRMSDDLALIQTIDFFTPVVDDAATYGAIAAANAMSDVFAMGGDVLIALNVAAFPDDLPAEVAAAILDGAAAKVAEAGGIVAGGHTILDPEPKFGLSVTGTVHPERIWTKAGAQPGDLLFLTKPLGTALINTAAKRGAARPDHVAAVIDSMLTLNKDASEAARAFQVHAATDVTGFSLLGNSAELAVKSGVSVVIEASAVPALPGALDYAEQGYLCDGLGRNRSYYGASAGVLDGDGGVVTMDEAIPEPLRALLWDPQTSGGLLLSVAPDDASALQDRFAALGLPIWPVGRVEEGVGKVLVSR
jgi:selenide,water dikinase